RQLRRRVVLTRVEPLGEVRGILDAFQDEEQRREEERDDEEERAEPRPAPARRPHGERDRERAREEDERVERAERDVHVLPGDVERRAVEVAVRAVEREEPGEEERLGAEEGPHAEPRRLVLLGEVLELLAELGAGAKRSPLYRCLFTHARRPSV